MSTTVYALYDGGELYAVGTAGQLAVLLGCSPSTIYRYASGADGGRFAAPVDELCENGVPETCNTDALCEVCAAIVRATLGTCRESGVGCVGLGWCLPCYRGALRLASERGRG